MQTSTWTRDLTAGLPKRGHGPQLSISDDNHHVTEAIGDMYGDSDYGRPHDRPLSFQSSPHNDSIDPVTSTRPAMTNSSSSKPTLPRIPLTQTFFDERVSPPSMSPTRVSPSRRESYGMDNGPLSPTRSIRDPSPLETANAHFPLNDVDYESSPAAVAQEMVNLQALRRMSMVDNAAGDPDLPSYNTALMPTAAPTGADDEEDTSRLFWVPARIHPELAPKEFKTFLETRVDQIKRRSSGDGDLLPPDGLQRQGSGGGLRRKKSMLSRQIDNSGGRAAEGYRDGAERLERKRSLSGQHKPDLKVADLQDLDMIPQDPSQLMKKLSLDTTQSQLEGGGEVPASEDMPILPAAPPGNSLRRSTRTTYRRGSLRKGERVPPSKRAARSTETDGEDSPISSPVVPGADLFGYKLSQVQTDSASASEDAPESPSVPSRLGRARAAPSATSPAAPFDGVRNESSQTHSPIRASAPPATFAQRVAAEKHSVTNGRPATFHDQPDSSVPKIVETPPPSEEDRSASPFTQTHIPERVSSHEPPPTMPPQGPLPPGPPKGNRMHNRQPLIRQAQNPRNQTLSDIVGQPSPLPGNSTRTDSLSFIPTFSDDRKFEKKSKDKKDRESEDGSRKSSWSWLLGNEEKNKDKDKDPSKKAKAKVGKPVDKSHENTRLDLLQTSIDGGRGRESLVLDRGDVRLEEERKKESNRKTSGEAKKEKDSGLFSSIFGGGKKKGDRESGGKKDRFSRGLSPDPPHLNLKPDVDYNWTRFSLLEERAIYRMAHIKLANPRRALYSQVLLSNFMYSYLAKVQQMHPQVPVAQGPGPAAPKPRQQAQPGPGQPQQRSQAEQERQDHQYYQYHDQPAPSDGVQYVDDSQIYNYDHQHQQDHHQNQGSSSANPGYRPQSRASQHPTETDGDGYHNQYHRASHSNPTYSLQNPFDEPGGSGSGSRDDNMW
ncbi:MAG: hypothetical protein M1817_003169 [Caeruleum heppii]|nr:MAG: hypothetical protein M1817_003169 [Caeruleum heppii]